MPLPAGLIHGVDQGRCQPLAQRGVAGVLDVQAAQLVEQLVVARSRPFLECLTGRVDQRRGQPFAHRGIAGMPTVQPAQPVQKDVAARPIVPRDA